MSSMDNSLVSVLAIREKGVLTPNLSSFETLGIKLINDSYNKAFTVFDEFGFLESSYISFTRTALLRLDSPSPILGVLRLGDSDFLNAISKHGHTEIIKVTAQNRSEIRELLSTRFIELQSKY